MRHMPALFLAFGLLATPAFAEDAETTGSSSLDESAVPAVLEKAVDAFIRPGYRTFATRASALSADMTALCATPSDAAYAKAMAAFGETVTAWSAIEIVRVGPVLGGNRFERVLFYPDRKSTGMKQVQALLSEPDEAATSAEGVAGKSVAMQGLGALDFVLGGTGAEVLKSAKQSFRCRYGAAVAGNIASIAHELKEEWDKPGGVQDTWKHPGPDNAEFRDAGEAVTALLGILVHGAEMVRDQRIETIYKGADAPMHPKQAIFWRTGNTWPSVAANLKGLQDLLDTSGMETLLDADQRSIVSSIDFVMKSLIRTAKGLNPDIDAALASDTERAKLDFMLLNSRDLIVRLNDGYGGAVGLSAGFSFADGD